MGLVAAIAVTGCATHPKPAELAPARTSNQATRQSIKDARVDIKFSQAKASAGASALQKADVDLNTLLNEAPRTRVATTETTLPVVVVTPSPTPTLPPTPVKYPSLWKRLFSR